MSRRRTLLVAGASLLAAGLAVLSYVAWQLVGTTVVSEHRQAATVERTERAWELAPARPLVRTSATALVRIPRFGDDYVVPVLDGVDEDALSGGFGRFEGSAGPGGLGNFALAGHRITHGQPLRAMPDLRPGDEVVVETRTAVHTYELDTDAGELEVGNDEGWVVEPRPVDGLGHRLITLVTCAELFHTDQRLVAFGHLVSTVRK